MEITGCDPARPGGRVGSRRLLARSLAAATAALLLALPAAAQQEDFWYEEPVQDMPHGSLRMGIGFTLTPGAFAMGLAAPVFVHESLAITPDLGLALDDKDTLVTGSVLLEIHVGQVARRAKQAWIRSLSPYLFLGAGFASIDKEQPDRKGNDEDGVGLNLLTGIGLESEVATGVHVGTQVRFNALPVEVADEGFFFTWQVATIRFDF